MRTMNWARIVLCGLVAGGVWSLLGATIMAFVGGEFLAAVPGARPNVPGGVPFGFLANLAAGLWAMWLYAAIRPRYGPGPKTAVVAGVAWWVIESLQSGKWVALLSIPPRVILAPLAATLLAIIVAAVGGAWLYESERGFSRAVTVTSGSKS
ncbi:MAG: hypothetical protein HY710_13830 [Candidatus Latescibacteria bacterium]|nr:hypothetical protein [Candidatus Latescibacterota bacterium]